ncbi:carnitine 3-dehydrogenase [Alphaproteobacteria bacterium]|jgi:carnitine 3-dehydrogenase|nr:carnitine 3-dehydrogenase [Alphaproteobacteria bacterium]
MTNKNNKPQTAAVVGGGVIGGGWIARLVLNGVDVRVFDPDPEAQRKIAEIMANAEHAMMQLTMAPHPKRGTLVFADSIADAVSDAALIVEAVPERLDIKQPVYAEIEKSAAVDAIISSSTSGILPSDLQAKMRHPERLMVGHPFNPVYLLPLVEMVGGKLTSQDTIERARGFYLAIGMHPLHVRKEIEAFIADRFLEAVWREALWLIKDEIATTEEIDDAIRFGFGLRWAQMGLFETYRMAGGEAGMAHFIAQFGPCLKWPWTKLMDVPELTDELVNTIAAQSDAQSGMHSMRELERIRDTNLVAIMQSLKVTDWGAGRTLANWEQTLYDAAPVVVDADVTQPLETMRRSVPAGWTDYNGHMNEARYLDCFSEATDAFMRMCGIDAAYVAAGGSYFTVETHIRHLDEVKAGAQIFATTQVMTGAGKKLHLFHHLYEEMPQGAAAKLLASGEHMLLHVDMKSRASSLPSPAVAKKLAEFVAAHADLPKPDGAGASVGVK